MNRVLERFARNYTYVRPAPGTWVNGYWSDGTAPAPVTFIASIQPLSGRQMLLLPEEERSTEQINVFTEFQLQVVQEPTQKGDIITYNGRTWEVQNQQNWDQYDYPFYAYRAKLVEIT